jgi:3-hydroxybutyryl-CoA dehydrogenase
LTDQSTNPDVEPVLTERLAIAGSGAIACGLAAVAATRGELTLLARSPESAERAADTVKKNLGRMFKEEPDKAEAANAKLTIVTDPEGLADATYVVEAIIEKTAAKAGMFAAIKPHIADDAILGTTTSSLSISELAAAWGQAERFVGLHVFNPVPRMELVELAFPEAASESTRERSRALCLALGKKAVEVPDTPGFVVNRLLFPYLFEAVRLQERTGLESEAIDTCMQLGAGHPLGPLALLDLVGLDVSKAIGETIGVEIPDRVNELIADGALGRKSKRGFYTY